MSWRLKEGARRILADEIGTSYKHTPCEVKIVLAYPDTYHIGMSSLGFQAIYNILNQRVDTLCERVFLPEKHTIPEYLRTNTPLFSLESQRPIREFDIIAFSIYFEENFLNILRILDLGKIPIWAYNRPWPPLIIGGGPVSYINPEPIADFFDLFILGEAEEVLNEFIDTFRKAKEIGLNKEEILLELSKIEGVYLPGILPKMKVVKRQVTSLDLYPTSSSIITPYTEFANRYLIEVSRGCPMGCRFCVLRSINYPFRFRSLDVLLEQAREGLKFTKKIGLVAAGEEGYPQLERLVSKIKEAGGEVSISSIRFEYITPSLLKNLNQWTLSLAPEAGNELLRSYLGKEIKDEEIFKGVKTASHYVPNLKLYFMIGLPQENDKDIDDLIDLVRKIEAMVPRINLTVSISPFIPKPHTPFQWRRLEDVRILRRRLMRIKHKLSGIRVVSQSIRLSLFQAVMSRGDRKLSKVLYLMYSQNLSLRLAFEAAGLNMELYIQGWDNYEEPLPWDHLISGPCKEYLIDQDRRVPR